MADKSREIAREFSADSAVAQTVDLYKRVLAGTHNNV
jgi:hypothetical protein